jgi:DNA-binding response OmpR family regulator
MNILLVEDEPRISEFVCEGLAQRGFTVTVCADGNAGFAQGLRGGFEAIVLDLMLPGRDGLSVLRGWRADGVVTPVLLLTARNELGDRVEGLNLGADDFLAKPFFVEELAARLQAVQRRLSGARQATLQVGALVLDRIERCLVCAGRSAELTSREYALLEVLMRGAGRTFSRSQLLEHVWGYDFDPSTNLVDVCVQRLRRKIAALEAAGEAASPIESVRGVGYRFRLPGAG